MIEYFNEHSYNYPLHGFPPNVNYELFEELEKIEPEEYRAFFGHSIPTYESIKEISNFIYKDYVFEIGAGKGFWAYCISEFKKTNKIFCTDLNSLNNGKEYMKITIMDCLDAVEMFSGLCNIIMIIWPPYNDMAYESLKKFKKQKLIYVGEWRGGMTANDKFFDHIENEFKLYKKIKIPNIFNHTDSVYMFIREMT